MTGLHGVAWDIDGTLVDSEALHHLALLAGSLTWGVDLSDLPDQHFRGIHMADVWTILRPRIPTTVQKAEWLKAITAHYIANRTTLKPLPGAVATIKALAARNIPQACVSNSHRSIVDANLDALDISRFMAFTISFDDVSAGKPDPEPYAMAARRFGAAPADILAVEDSEAGMISAARAGLRVAVCAPLSIAERWSTTVTEVSNVADILRWF